MLTACTLIILKQNIFPLEKWDGGGSKAPLTPAPPSLYTYKSCSGRQKSAEKYNASTELFLSVLKNQFFYPLFAVVVAAA